MKDLKTILNEISKELKETEGGIKKIYKFDVFKGRIDETGKVIKICTLGQARLLENSETYNIYIKSLLSEVFYLRQIKFAKENKEKFTILTREKSFDKSTDFRWNYVGNCQSLQGENSSLLKMNWDFFGVDDVYMNLVPYGYSIKK